MPVFESSRKIQEFGSSLAMTLPALFVKVNEIKKGTILNVLFGLKGVLILTSSEDPAIIKECLQEIISKLDEFEEILDLTNED